MIAASYACTLIALAVAALAVCRLAQLERVVRSVRGYRDHGTASAWRGVLIQLDRLDGPKR